MAKWAMAIKNTTKYSICLGAEILPNNHGILVNPFLALPGEQRRGIAGPVQEYPSRNPVQPHLHLRLERGIFPHLPLPRRALRLGAA